MGLIVGLLVGLGIALGVALFVTKGPLPFVNKVPQRTADQDAAEAQRNKNWDPNAALSPRPPVPARGADVTPLEAAAAAASAALSAPPGVILPPPVDGVPVGISSPTRANDDPYTYFVQVGAYSRPEDAEQQRARLAMMDMEARITEREQAGRTVYRVRVGPFDKKNAADSVKARLDQEGMEAALVRVQN